MEYLDAGLLGDGSDRRTLVRAVWCEVLETSDFGDNDDFFAVGGHSLLLARVAARLSKAIGLKVPVRMLMNNATVDRMVTGIAELAASSAPESTSP